MNRSWLLPLSPVYGAGLAAKNLAFDRGWLRSHQLHSPVISIGNLSVGGSGKTPFTIWLAPLLVREGFAVDVLSRGYGRKGKSIERVDAAGEAGRFGDEPLLIAQRTGLPVFVGADRYRAGLLAEGLVSVRSASPETPFPRIHLLDDGFQHRKLVRKIDIVLLHRSDFHERLLPAGRLREPFSALRRADFVVVRVEDAELERHVRSAGVEVPIWRLSRSLRVPEGLAGSRVVAFCGIARPAEFFSALAIQRVQATIVAFRDHHPYSREDVLGLVKAAQEGQAQGFLTTEKDKVKLTPELLRILEEFAPVHAARLEVAVVDEPSMLQQLVARLCRN